MSLQIADNFSYKGRKPLDARLVCNDIPDMLALPTSTIYDGIIVYVVVQKKFYTYDSNNTVDPTLQQWRELTTAGILIQSATIDNVTTSATKGHLILTMSDGTTIDCGDAKGDKGDKGDGFAIIKLYTNVSDMTSDTNPVNDGQMVAIIDSSTIPLIAKVYIRNSSQTQDASGNENGYTFFCNLADATVIQGPQGPQGQKGDKGDTPVVTTQAIAATSTTPSGTKITFTTGTGSTAVSTSINVYNGKNGISVQSATINASGELVFTLSDASTINVGKIGGNGTGGCITMLGCFDTAPTTFVQNDIYYNNLDGLIYKSPDGTTWGTGLQPEKDILYISMDDHKIYSYTNNTFEVYGGGMIDISSKANNAIKNITGSTVASENGLYVEDLKTEINKLNYAQKTAKGETGDYFYATNSDPNAIFKKTPMASHQWFGDFLTHLNDIKTNMDPSMYNLTDGYVTLKAGITYEINYCPQFAGCGIDWFITDKANALAVTDRIGSNGCGGAGGSPDTTVEATAIYTPTTDTNIYFAYTCPPKTVLQNYGYTNLVCSTGYSYIKIRQLDPIVVDPVEYVDSTKGIEDTPVGEIIRTLGDKTPKHYLACDGSVYNIADYPHLAQYFKDNFGSSNAFGGDGTTTFAVPDLSEPPELTKISPIMTSDTTPSPYKVTRSSVWSSADHAWRVFDGVKTGSEDYTWISAANELNPWICVDLGTKTKITSFKLWLGTDKNKFPKNFTLQGSNDGTNFVNIKSFTNVSSMAQASDGEIEFNLDRIAKYRYYKIYVDTLQITAGSTYVKIFEWEMFYQYSLYRNCIKYEPTYFMNLEGVEVTEDLLTDKSFDITTNGVTTIDKSFALPTPITDFDEIETVYSYEKAEVVVKDSVSGTVATATELTPTSNYKGLNFPGTSTSGITYSTISGLTYPLTVEIAFSTTSTKKFLFVHDAKLGLAVGVINGYIQLATSNNTSIANMTYDISNWNLDDGNFHTITVTYNSANSANLYFDGVLKSSTTYSNTWDMSNVSSIGNRFNIQYDGPYKGILYAVRFYNGILSQSDIVASYNSDKNYVLNNTPQIARNNLACEYSFYNSVEIMHSYTTSSKLSVRDIEYNSVLSVDKSVQNVTNNKAAYTELQYTFTDKNNVKFLNVSNHYNNYLPGSKFGIRRLTGIRKISK